MAKRRPRDETRVLILEQAHKLVREQGMPEAIGFRLNDALASLNLTTGAAYNIWESQDAFRLDLALHIARSYEWERPTELIEKAAQIPGDVEYLDAVDELSQAYFDSFVERPEFYLALYFWTVYEPTEELAASIREGYDLVHEGFSTFVTLVLERYGYEVTPPQSVSSLAVAVSAALEGAALRYRFDPSAIQTAEGALFGRFVAALFESSTQPRRQAA